MKSLNRTLSLVLVLAMVFGLMGVASASSFTDAAKVQYTEAVDVMTGIGAINGLTDGSFNPTGSITREEAAKLVAYAVLGADIAKTLTITSSTFSDVAATRWSAPFITYCAGKGIINGNGDGTFAPTGNVTGYQLGKMLLAAAGYGKQGEYTGASWELNVAIDANRLGVFTGTKATSFTVAATREEAALYVFNAITKIELVVWDTTKSTYVEKDGAAGTANNINTTVYPSLLKVTPAGSVDVFGRPTARTWTYLTKTISTVFAATPVATFTTPVTLSALYNTLGCTESAKLVTYYFNGVKGTDVTADKADVSATTAIGGYGQTTELYKDADGNMSAVVIANYLATVTGVTAYKAATSTSVEVPASITVTVNTVSFTSATTADKSDLTGKTFETTGFAKGDMIYVTMAGTGKDIQSAKKATAVDGVMSAYGTGYIVANGQKIPLSKYAQNLSKANPDAALIFSTVAVGFTDTYTVYLDNNMAIVGAKIKTVAVPTDYAYVLSTQCKNDTGSLLGSAAQAAKAKVIFTDGTLATVDMAITDAGATADPRYSVALPITAGTAASATLVTDSAALTVGNWFAYTKTAAGVYSFSAVSSTYAAVVSAPTLNAKATTVLGSNYTTSATAVTAIDTNLVKTSFTGIPTTSTALTGKVLYTYAKDATTVSAIYAVNQAAATASVTYAYALAKGNTTSNGTEWTFAVNGAQVTYVITGTTTTSPAVGKIYTLTSSTNSNYTVTEVVTDSADPHVVVKTTGAVVSIADATFFVAGSSYTYGTSYGVYNVASTNATSGSKDTVAVGDTVTIITVSGAVTAVYITTEG